MADIQKLAEKIARLLEAESQGGDLAEVFAGLEKINHRLDKLEAAHAEPRVAAERRHAHPSQEKFAVLEAFADEIFDGIKKEKTCTFEPNGRPCDHCSMCSSRGF